MSSAPPPPPPPPGPPVMASTSKQTSKKAGQNRSVLLSDIQKGTKLKSSKHLTNDRSGLVIATNGKPSQNNGTVGVYGGSSGRNSVGAVDGVSSGKTNRGPPNLGDLFAGGIPRLRSTANSSQLESSEAPDGLKRKSQVVRSITQEDGPRMKSSEPSLTNSNTNHVSNMSLRRVSTGTLKKPPIPGNKPALLGPKPSVSFCQRTSTLTEADKPFSESQPIVTQPAKPPTPPAKPLYMQNLSRESQTIGRKNRPVSCAPSFSTASLEATSFLNMAESPFAFPIPRPCVAEPAKTGKHPQSTVSGAQTLNHVKSDHVRVYPRPSATPPPLPKRETNGSAMSNSVEDATDYSYKAVSPSTSSCKAVSPPASTVKESSESRSQRRTRQKRSSVAEVPSKRSSIAEEPSKRSSIAEEPSKRSSVAAEPSLSSSFLISYDRDFEGQFRFHREKELPPPDTFKDSHKTYPSKNAKNPANRGSFAVW